MNEGKETVTVDRLLHWLASPERDNAGTFAVEVANKVGDMWRVVGMEIDRLDKSVCLLVEEI